MEFQLCATIIGILGLRHEHGIATLRHDEHNRGAELGYPNHGVPTPGPSSNRFKRVQTQHSKTMPMVGRDL